MNQQRDVKYYYIEDCFTCVETVVFVTVLTFVDNIIHTIIKKKLQTFSRVKNRMFKLFIIPLMYTFTSTVHYF